MLINAHQSGERSFIKEPSCWVINLASTELKDNAIHGTAPVAPLIDGGESLAAAEISLVK